MVGRLLPLPLAALTVCLLWQAQPGAWGFDVHRFITERAIAELPAEMQPFFQKHRAFVAEHSIDPDLWRNAGFEEEPPRHYVDLDMYGVWPFKDLPRDFDLAVAKFGREKVEKNGTLPWRVGEIHAALVKAFSQHQSGSSPYALDNAQFHAAVLSHYVADAHVPFHSVINYDGQLTNQHGIHSRFESELYARYRDRLRIVPPKIAPARQPVDFVFDTLIEGFPRVEAILAADREALGARETYDDEYFERFFKQAQPHLEAQLSRAIGSVAAAIAGAWEAAGRPVLPTDPAPRPARRKRVVTTQP